MTDEKEYVDVSRLDVVAYTRPDGSTDYQNGFEDGVSFILDKVDNLPREKASPIVYAHWVYLDDYAECSLCERLVPNVRYRYCPYCGAKMDEEMKK